MNIVTIDHPQFSDYKEKLVNQDIHCSSLYQPGSLAYYAAYFEHVFVDASFCVSQSKEPVLLVLVSEAYKDCLSYYGLPVRLVWNVSMDLSEQDQQHALKAAYTHIQSMMVNKNLRLDYKERLGSSLSFLAISLLKQGKYAKTIYDQIVNLNHTEEFLFSDIRKNYRADIRWGEKHIDLKLIDKQTVSATDMDDFRNLHINVAGRETRSVKSWQCQQLMIERGEAYAYFGYYNNELVGASLFIANSTTCYYGVGAYVRSLFDKPISHVMVWKGIQHAKQIGCHHFEMGEVFFPVEVDNSGNPENAQRNKEIDISRFKQGFGGDIVPSLAF